MRVLHIASGNLYGGVEALLITLARLRTVCPGMEPHFAVCFEGRLSRELIAAGVPVHTIGALRASRPWTIWRARRAVRAILRRQAFDLAVCHSAWPQALLGPAARSAGTPLIFWLHDAVRGRSWPERWARLTRPELAICNSRFTATRLKNIYPRMTAAVVHCPVPEPARSLSGDREAVRCETRTPQDAVVIVQTSRLEPLKGYLLHLEALSRLKDLPEWVCWFVGGAQRPHELTYLDAVQSRTARLGLAERIRFLGERPDVARVLAAADIYCQPNTGPEAFGISFVEAFFAKLPVITTAIGAANEVIDSSCGEMVPPDDPEALARALRRLIQSPRERCKLGEAGPARARLLSDPGQQIRRVHEAFRQLYAAC